ncbi:conserved hypothetical protein [Anaeromyxobacter sp. K]|nr:conserved hypothetical protein [Anaeromyxobacter sp. K]
MTIHAAAGANEGATHGTRVELPAAMPRKVSGMKIRINFEGKVITGTLADTESARDFASMLPLTLTLKDYSGTEKISDLPRRLSTKGAPAGSDPSIGDLAYYAPWGNLALFYKDFGYSSGLVTLGKLDSGVEVLSGRDPVKVTIELVK